MPFKSEKQKKWMFSNKPEMAKEWSKEEKKGKNVSKSKLRKGKKRYVAQGAKPTKGFV